MVALAAGIARSARNQFPAANITQGASAACSIVGKREFAKTITRPIMLSSLIGVTNGMESVAQISRQTRQRSCLPVR
jgi:hypothetical protein